MTVRLPHCTVQHATAPSPEHDVPLLVVKPTASARPPAQTPGILWIHGGGYVTGMPQMVFMSSPFSPNLLRSFFTWVSMVLASPK